MSSKDDLTGPLFGTPNFASNEPMVTPFKDLISPRTDDESLNRSTNRQSISYYNPDPSNYILKQVEAAIQSLESPEKTFDASQNLHKERVRTNIFQVSEQTVSTQVAVKRQKIKRKHKSVEL